MFCHRNVHVILCQEVFGVPGRFREKFFAKNDLESINPQIWPFAIFRQHIGRTKNGLFQCI